MKTRSKKLMCIFCYLVASILCFMMVTASVEAAEKDGDYLVVNNPRVKKFDYPIGNITVGNPSVVDFKADRENNRVTLFPKSQGNTIVIVYDKKGQQRDALQLTVYSADPDKFLDQVKGLLADVEGVSVKRVNDKIVIDGEVVLPSDKQRIAKIMASSSRIVDLSKMSSDTDMAVAKKIQREIGMDEVSVRSVRGKIVLEGDAYSEAAKIKAEKIASLYSDKVMNVIEVRPLISPPSREPTVEVTAHFVEVSKNFSDNFNFRWSPIPQVGSNLNYSVNPVTGSSNFTGALTGSATDLLPRLNYFKALGVARVLENPTVSVKNREEATIESGTKIGFPVAQGNNVQSLQFENVGVKLRIQPYVLGSDISMTVDLKISSLGAPDIQGGVAISQSSVQTSQIVRSGESVVIGGLVRHIERKIVGRPPSSSSSTPQSTSNQSALDPFPLGSLFTLFKSTDESKQRSQFMVFITPRIVQDSKDANRNVKEQFNLYEVYPDSLPGAK